MRSTILLLVYLLSMGLLSCSEDNPAITTNKCRATQQYAKTINQANARLIGSWSLVDVISLGSSSTPIQQTVRFDTTGHCLITQDGQQYGPYLYTVDSATSFRDQTQAVPRLTVIDSINTNPSKPFILYRIAIGQLYVCEQELVLDYGGNLKTSTRTYQRQ